MASDDIDATTPAADKLRRSWPQRLLIIGVVMASIGSFLSAGAIWFVQQQLESRNLVATEDGSDALDSNAEFGQVRPSPGDTDGDGSDADGADTGGSEEPATVDTGPVETFPPAEPAARNILVTGADNNSCIDPDSPYAAAFGNREGFGERSDTIMMWRVNPATSQVAVLSFPRDLWVTIDGRSSKNRINAAYKRDDPQRLINTIASNFGILTDHFIQVDFCAFKTMVDAVDGVSVPFERPVRDIKTGLNVPQPGCFEFDGDHALAYVRSRSLQVFDENGQWQTDGLSDLSRISRQQDFIRRVVDEAIANKFSPSVIRGLLDTSSDYIVTDDALTPDKILQFAGVLRSIDPATITTYQIQATGQTIQGNSVLVPRLSGSNMQAVLSLFRGDATLADRPDATPDAPEITTGPGTTVPLIAPTTTSDSAAPTTDGAAPVTDAPTTTVEAVPFETLPEIDAEDIVFGVVPDATISCAG